jgi:hypothetical protein
MPGFIQVRTKPVATAGVPFECTVFVVGAQPGDVVTVRLAQTYGVLPRYSGRADIRIAGDGSGVHVFTDVVLYGPDSFAQLLAVDIGSAFPVASGDASVAVVAP